MLDLRPLHEGCHDHIRPQLVGRREDYSLSILHSLMSANLAFLAKKSVDDNYIDVVFVDRKRLGLVLSKQGTNYRLI
jgi:hypothetical protein